MSVKALVVEDDPVNQELMTLLLERIGQKIEIAGNGQAALDLLYEGSVYDLILMDLHMPVMGGLEATEHLMAARTGDGRPRIVAVTADTTQEARTACEALGMSGFLAKPFAREQLAEMIHRVAA